MRRYFYRKKIVFFILTTVLLFAAGCTQQKNAPVDLSVFQGSLEYGTQWAVISEPYPTFRSGTAFDAPASGYGRRGDVLKIIGHIGIWYGFEKGWLPESSVIVYANELRAKRASESLQD